MNMNTNYRKYKYAEKRNGIHSPHFTPRFWSTLTENDFGFSLGTNGTNDGISIFNGALHFRAI